VVTDDQGDTERERERERERDLDRSTTALTTTTTTDDRMIAKCTMTTRTTACVRQTTACSVRRQATVAKVAKPDRFAEAKKVLRKELPKIEAAAVVGAATLTASPAFALVDRRLNGDGTRLPFGINDPILGWILVAVFGGESPISFHRLDECLFDPRVSLTPSSLSPSPSLSCRRLGCVLSVHWRARRR